MIEKTSPKPKVVCARCSIVYSVALTGVIVLCSLANAQQPRGLNAPGAGGLSPESAAALVLGARLQEAEQQILQLESRVPPLQSSVQTLTDQVAALKPIEDKPEVKKPDVKPAQKVPFRLPRMAQSEAGETIAIVCENNRVTILDVEQITEGFLKSLKSKRGVTSGGEESVSLPNGHFDLKYSYLYVPGLVLTITNEKKGETFSIESIYPNEQFAVRKSGHEGEKLDQLSVSSSEIARLISTSATNAKQTLIQFAVYPDSYEVFREVRAQAWAKGFEVRWNPVTSGQALSIGGGGLSRD